MTLLLVHSYKFSTLFIEENSCINFFCMQMLNAWKIEQIFVVPPRFKLTGLHSIPICPCKHIPCSCGSIYERKSFGVQQKISQKVEIRAYLPGCLQKSHHSTDHIHHQRLWHHQQMVWTKHNNRDKNNIIINDNYNIISIILQYKLLQRLSRGYTMVMLQSKFIYSPTNCVHQEINFTLF